MTISPAEVLAVLALIWSVGSTVAAGLIARHRASRKELDGLTRRVTALESGWDHMPNAKMVHDLEVSITRLSGDLNTTAAKLDGVGEWLNRVDGVTKRIEDHLLTTSRSGK